MAQEAASAAAFFYLHNLFSTLIISHNAYYALPSRNVTPHKQLPLNFYIFLSYAISRRTEGNPIPRNATLFLRIF